MTEGLLEAAELAAADEETLAVEARAGDHLAFGEIYRRYQPVLASYVRPKIGVGTEDTVQNVFVAIHRGLPSYRGPRFFPWAYRVCVNVVTDELRRRHRQGSEDALDGRGELDSGGPTPEEALLAYRLYGRLTEALHGLTEGQRAVFVLARVEGLEYTEIADLLGIPVGTVKSRMFKAVRTLLAVRGED